MQKKKKKDTGESVQPWSLGRGQIVQRFQRLEATRAPVLLALDDLDRGGGGGEEAMALNSTKVHF